MGIMQRPIAGTLLVVAMVIIVAGVISGMRKKDSVLVGDVEM